MNPEEAVMRYLMRVMDDKKADSKRRDKAADKLAKLIGANKRVKMRRMSKEQTALKVGGRGGKKEQKKARSEATATSNNWGDLIPKAPVVPLRRKTG